MHTCLQSVALMVLGRPAVEWHVLTRTCCSAVLSNLMYCVGSLFILAMTLGQRG